VDVWMGKGWGAVVCLICYNTWFVSCLVGGHVVISVYDTFLGYSYIAFWQFLL
jgi:hypothetical protein